MKLSQTLGSMLALVVLAVGCGHQTANPVAAPAPPRRSEDQLPFARRAQEGGISPSSTVIPPSARVPSGTLILIRLQSALSSATAHAGDTFDAVLDEPMIVNGRVFAEKGAGVIGRIMEAQQAARSLQAPGYLRLALSSMILRGRICAIRSTSTFVKGALYRNTRVVAATEPENGVLTSAAGIEKESSPNRVTAGKTPVIASMDVTVSPDRRLAFRLTEAVPLPE